MSRERNLHLIPVPIIEEGQWEMPAHLIEVIRSLDTIITERIRTTRRTIRRLFSQEEFDKLTFIELEKHEDLYLPHSIDRLTNDAVEIGLFSEAGSPSVADPGFHVVSWAHKQGIKVKPYVGPNSLLLALMASGLNGQSFQFHGYLPAKKERLRNALIEVVKELKVNDSAQMFIETPYRNAGLYEQILHLVPAQFRLCIAHSLNGPDEYIQTHRIEDWRKLTAPFDTKVPAIFVLGR